MFSLAVPALMVEGLKTVPAMRRSRELTQGHRSRLFSAFFVVGILTLVAGIAAGLVSVVFGPPESPGQAIAETVLGNLTELVLTPLGYIVSILFYYDLRIRKEGFDLEMLSRALTAQTETATSPSGPAAPAAAS
jgi:hypothetical protein